MYEFLGKMMGLAVRTRQCLELLFPSIVWKQLVRLPILREDLEAIDMMLVQRMDPVRSIERQDITEQLVQDVIMETFSTLTTDDRVVELVAGGGKRAVTFQDRGKFADMLEAYRMQEFQVQVQAIKKGLAQVLPQRLLNLFTWEELEVFVCDGGRKGLVLCCSSRWRRRMRMERGKGSKSH
jgi:hypothetical protein